MTDQLGEVGDGVCCIVTYRGYGCSIGINNVGKALTGSTRFIAPGDELRGDQGITLQIGGADELVDWYLVELAVSTGILETVACACLCITTGSDCVLVVGTTSGRPLHNRIAGDVNESGVSHIVFITLRLA